jgi:hypothetical protein
VRATNPYLVIRADGIERHAVQVLAPLVLHRGVGVWLHGPYCPSSNGGRDRTPYSRRHSRVSGCDARGVSDCDWLRAPCRPSSIGVFFRSECVARRQVMTPSTVYVTNRVTTLCRASGRRRQLATAGVVHVTKRVAPGSECRSGRRRQLTTAGMVHVTNLESAQPLPCLTGGTCLPWR